MTVAISASNIVETLGVWTASLDATVSGGVAPLTYAWTVVSKPVGSGTPSFDDDTAVDTDVANMDTRGTYVFRLTVTDDDSVVAHGDVAVSVGISSGVGAVLLLGGDPFGFGFTG